jgi:hypothetical protein
MKIPLRAILFILSLVPACNRNEPYKAQAASEDRPATRDDKPIQIAHADIKGDGVSGRAEFAEKTIGNGKQSRSI